MMLYADGIQSVYFLSLLKYELKMKLLPKLRGPNSLANWTKAVESFIQSNGPLLLTNYIL